MQRWGAQWAPDFMFSESTFTPLVPGPGCGANAQQLAAALAQPGEPRQLARIVSLLLARSGQPCTTGQQFCICEAPLFIGVSLMQISDICCWYQSLYSCKCDRTEYADALRCSYAAHHAKRVEVIAATDDQLQFELDTTDAQGRQVMLQSTAGASAMKVCCQCSGALPPIVSPLPCNVQKRHHTASRGYQICCLL